VCDTSSLKTRVVSHTTAASSPLTWPSGDSSYTAARLYVVLRIRTRCCLLYRCVPTGMHGPTCIFWANLTPLSLDHGARTLPAGVAGRFWQRKGLGGGGGGVVLVI
jgi:hypothetical protein